MINLKDKVASYVVDYPWFEESANEIADLILDVVVDAAIEEMEKVFSDPRRLLERTKAVAALEKLKST